MRRRITIAVLAAVAATLAISGGVTLLLVRLNARAETEEELRQQVEIVAATLSLASGAVQGRIPPREQLEIVRRQLEVREMEVVVLSTDGSLPADLGNTLPSGLDLADLEPDLLLSGETVSGSSGSKVFAAAPVRSISRVPPAGASPLPGAPPVELLLPVVVITREPDDVLGPAVRWFLVAAGVTLAVGALGAWRLGTRLARPLEEATRATRRIAAGDLATRLAIPEGRRDEIADLSRSIQSMAESLARARSQERHFLMSVSHDLRTPLTSIQGYAEAITDGTAPSAEQAAAVILAETRRLERLVRDLLDLAKLDARRFSLALQDVDVGELLEEVVQGFRRLADEAELDLDLEWPTGLFARADRDRLGQVIANLIENAYKHARSRIDIKASVAGDDVRIAISDDGDGIPEEDLPRVFDRLYAAPAAGRRSSPGSGLGLSIVKELVGAMGGTVEAASSADPGTGGAATARAGTRILVTVPRSQSAKTES